MSTSNIVNSSFEKVIRDGKVAVLVSPGFGAGWYTWNSELGERLIFDRALVEYVEAGRRKELTEQKVKELLGLPAGTYIYCGGADDLEIEWLPVGTAFEISEYDGSESILIRDDNAWVIA